MMEAEPPLEKPSAGARVTAIPGSRFQGVGKWEAKLIFYKKKMLFSTLNKSLIIYK
jgi:hypothetical protein